MKTIAYLFLLLVLICAPAYAETTETEPEPEQVALTTYYPAPYGDYDELASETIYANRIAIGDANGDGSINENDIPQPGKIAVENSVIYKPRAGDPTAWGAGTEGELAYSSANDSFYYYNGSQWAAQGGGSGSSGGCYTNYFSSTCYTGYDAVITGYTAYLWAYNNNGVFGDATLQTVEPVGLLCKPGMWDPGTTDSWSFIMVKQHHKSTEFINSSCAVCCKK